MLSLFYISCKLEASASNFKIKYISVTFQTQGTVINLKLELGTCTQLFSCETGQKKQTIQS